MANTWRNLSIGALLFVAAVTVIVLLAASNGSLRAAHDDLSSSSCSPSSIHAETFLIMLEPASNDHVDCVAAFGTVAADLGFTPEDVDALTALADTTPVPSDTTEVQILDEAIRRNDDYRIAGYAHTVPAEGAPLILTIEITACGNVAFSDNTGIPFLDRFWWSACDPPSG